MCAQVVVTGLGSDGRSTIDSSDPVADKQMSTIHRLPFVNRATAETTFLRFTVPSGDAEEGGLHVPMHETGTTDLIYLAEGTMELVTDTTTALVSAGDFVVINGHSHGWRNVGSTSATLVGVMIPMGGDR